MISLIQNIQNILFYKNSNGEKKLRNNGYVLFLWILQKPIIFRFEKKFEMLSGR